MKCGRCEERNVRWIVDKDSPSVNCKNKETAVEENQIGVFLKESKQAKDGLCFMCFRMEEIALFDKERKEQKEKEMMHGRK